jgi:hypothetical protein
MGKVIVNAEFLFELASKQRRVFAKGWNSSTSAQQQQMPGFANG